MANRNARPARKAISSLIATVLVTFITVVALGLTLAVVIPTFNRAKDTSVINDEFDTLATLDTAVKEVASEPDGSKRDISITVTDGMLRTDTTKDWMYFEYTPIEPLDLSGTKGIAHVERGLEFADYFSSYADGGKATPAWTNISGQAVVSSGVYSITNGTSYHNISTSLSNWQFSATITNVSGKTGGEVFVLPTNPEKLVGYWTFDEVNGSNAYDWSGNNNTGTLTSMNTTGNATSGWQQAVNCKGGVSCLKFDGVDDYVNVDDSTSLRAAPPFTVSFWMKLEETGNWMAFNKGNPGDDNNWYIYGDDNWDPITVYWYGGVQYKAAALGLINMKDVWRHVVIVYPAAGSPILFYADGSLLKTGDNMPAGTSFNTGPLHIGMYAVPGAYNFVGNIDEAMIFNRSLSADEVKALYETGTKKLLATGTQTITSKATPAIILSNPAGQTKFDDVLVTSAADDKLTLLVPYANIDLSGSLRLSKGSYSVQVRHVATNSTTNKPIIELTAA